MNTEEVRALLSKFPRTDISVLPTALHRLENVSRDLEANVYCKRDDLTGFAFGGNKTRKLDYLIAEALEAGYDTLLTMGALQSNFCRMAAGAAVTRGMEAHLVLGGREPERFTGNLLVDKLLGAHIHAVDTMEWGEWAEHATRVEEELKSGGKKVYLLPVGGSVPTGILGYVEGFVEILEDCRRSGLEFGRIFLADGSLGTHAGLLIGASLCAWPGEIVGISVAKPAAEARAGVEDLCRQTLDRLGQDVVLPSVVVDDAYIGECYGRPTEAGREAIGLFCRREGVFLDEVYSGKAAAGMIGHIRDGRAKRDENVLFLHTGGNIELFA
jgi:D-cysteine desulfhydrase family pyridoxal phosphate-dependent enzyme